MTRFTLSLLLTCSSIVAHTQINKSNWILGGRLNGSSNEATTSSGIATEKYSRFQINSEIGHFIIDKLSGGIILNFENITQKTSSGKSIENVIGIGPFIRYYFLPTENLVNIFVQPSYTFGNIISKTTTKQKYRSNTFSIIAGPEIFFTSNVGLEFTVGYAYNNLDNSIKTNSILFGAGFHFHLERDK